MALLQRMERRMAILPARFYPTMDMVLQSDMHLAKRNSELVPDQDLARTVFASLEEGMAPHDEGADEITGHERRGSPTTRRWPPRSAIASLYFARSTI